MDLAAAIDNITIGDNIPTLIRNFAAVIGTNHTEIVICNFTNCTKYIITQFGKIGNFYSVNLEKLENGQITTEPVYRITQILGADNIEIEVAIRFLAEKLQITKPLYVSLTLKDYKYETLNTIIKAIDDYNNN